MQMMGSRNNHDDNDIEDDVVIKIMENMKWLGLWR